MTPHSSQGRLLYLVNPSNPLEEQLQHLLSLTAITAAEVVLEHQREAKPAFRVQARLEVPGPGTHAKATRPRVRRRC